MDRRARRRFAAPGHQRAGIAGDVGDERFDRQLAELVDVDVTAVREHETRPREGLVEGAVVAHDVHERLARPVGDAAGVRCDPEDRLQRVERALGRGAWKRMQVGLVAELGPPGVEVAAKLCVHESFEDGNRRRRRERIAAGRLDVECSCDVGDEGGAVVDVGGHVVEGAVEIGEHDEAVDAQHEVVVTEVLGLFEQRHSSAACRNPSSWWIHPS